MISFKEKILQLKGYIEEALLPLIDNDYVLWDLPYHNNIGDLLIWEGEISFLKTIQHKCLDKASKDTCTFPKLSDDTVILLHGGGNFGDIWREMQEFRLAVIRHYPNNKIIVFPQTVYYANKDLIKGDAQIMEQHKSLIICARDCTSYELLKKNFSNKILLVPDMAFYIPIERLKKYQQIACNETLFLKRTDQEFKNINYSIQPLYPMRTCDWPSMEHQTMLQLGLRVLFKLSIPRMIDWYVCNVFKEYIVKQGVQFVSHYKEIYTTRLHVAILSVLLEKPFHFFDNSYGKNRSYFESWLTDVDGIQFHKPQ